VPVHGTVVADDHVIMLTGGAAARRRAGDSRWPTWESRLSNQVTITCAGSGDAFGSGGRLQACFHVQPPASPAFLLDCGATSMTALKRLGLDPGGVGSVFVSHLHGDHFGGLPFFILDAQFSKRDTPLTIAGPVGLARRLTEAMEVLFPESSTIQRRFDVHVVELAAGNSAVVGDVHVTTFQLDHPSGATALGLRVRVGQRTIAYTGDTAWTDALKDLAAGADLLIAEAYYREKSIPYHLQLADLVEHAAELDTRRIVLTHMSADMLDSPPVPFERAHDGYVIRI
jgi:ribonuclease BN (tRNA processing enzyme)